MSEWIKCSDVMPEQGQHVLCSGFYGGRQDTKRFVTPSTFHAGVFREYTDEDDEESVDCKGSYHHPTHWQPLPTPPTE